MDTVAKKLRFLGDIYEYSHAKDNVLIYTLTPEYYYEDWQEDGGILVVKYRPELKSEKDRYFVLHHIVITINGNIIHDNISDRNKIPEIVE